MTMISRVLGLVRDVLFARFLGAEASADAFYVAFKIPNFLRRLFAEGAFAQAFVPVLSEYRAQGSQEAVRNFIDRIAGCLGSALIMISVLVVVAAPIFTGVFGMGFMFNNPEKFQLTTELLRITFPYLLLISLTGFAGSILNSYDQFAVPAFTPVLLNISLIVAAAVVSPMMQEPVYALAWGVIVAGILQLAFQVPFLLRLGLLPHPKVDWGDESVTKVLKLMAPAMFGVSVGQINLLFDTILASFLPDGSITWLYFSDRLTELPLGVFGVGIATVVLPNLSRQFISGAQRYSATLDWALRMIMLIGFPAALALVVLAEPILFALFQYGEYRPVDVQMSSYSLRAYALGLVAFMMIKVLASGYFSRQDTRTPVRIGIIAMVVNMGMNLLFVLPFHFYWQMGHAGLALATSCSAFLNAGLLYRGLRREKVYQPDDLWLRFGGQMLIANIAMVAFLLIVMRYMGDVSSLEAYGRIVRVLSLCVAGIGIYVFTLWVMGIRPRHLRVAS
ncbi:murein biosynthesis integral membrane protein MurJ [Teredinibacter purpureus]|uniref:murein biosynthesis integral membrane protein MurJ n=1 Tax=Teredinibacter purpureus TaxID=2731756 RepID=UPI000EB5EC42